MILPPGTILQFMYLKERISQLKPGYFLEIGCGPGNLSKILLTQGWKGIGFDLNVEALHINKELNQDFIKRKLYAVNNFNFFSDFTLNPKKFELIVSSMVLEHFDENMEHEYFLKCKSLLKKGGRIILFLPASQGHWGIEDEIAGHFRRYDRNKIIRIAEEHNLKVECLSGLTYPFSNLLLPLSNYLVKKHESNKISLSNHEKTIKSGYREVKGKTVFPIFLKLLLNEFILYPMHIVQKIFKKNKNCLVIYTELTAI